MKASRYLVFPVNVDGGMHGGLKDIDREFDTKEEAESYVNKPGSHKYAPLYIIDLQKYKRYLCFSYNEKCPDGGWSDFRNSFDTEEEAKEYCDLPFNQGGGYYVDNKIITFPKMSTDHKESLEEIRINDFSTKDLNSELLNQLLELSNSKSIESFACSVSENGVLSVKYIKFKPPAIEITVTSSLKC